MHLAQRKCCAQQRHSHVLDQHQQFLLPCMRAIGSLGTHCSMTCNSQEVGNEFYVFVTDSRCNEPAFLPLAALLLPKLRTLDNLLMPVPN